jgi:hypothetical protein
MTGPRKPVYFRICIDDDRPLFHSILCLLIGLALLELIPQFHCLINSRAGGSLTHQFAPENIT